MQTLIAIFIYARCTHELALFRSPFPLTPRPPILADTSPGNDFVCSLQGILYLFSNHLCNPIHDPYSLVSAPIHLLPPPP